MSVVDTDDFDIYVKVNKLDSNGNVLVSRCIDVGYLQDDPEGERRKLEAMYEVGNKGVGVYFHEGPNGILRASHRELDLQKSTPHHPLYTHRAEEKLHPGQIVPLVIELWPYGMIWEAGEKLKLTISGHRTWAELLPHLESKKYNRGEATVYSGGRYDSHLLVPVIPE
jgi:hypothetical protein